MKAKALVVVLLLVVLQRVETQTVYPNCSSPGYQLTSEQYSTSGDCSSSSGTRFTITQTENYDIWATTTSGADTPNYQYYSGKSSLTGYGQCYAGGDYTFCPPLMSMQATTAMDSNDYNRFYNRAQDRVQSYAHCENGAFRQDFQQSSAWPCSSGGGGGGSGECDTCTGADSYCIGDAGCTPILLAIGADSNYPLTGPAEGVAFDLDGNGILTGRLGWTACGAEIGFLVNDRNGNGLIDDGSELFGNYSLNSLGQRAANGFAALAEFDQPANGGNGDGSIDAADLIWTQLKVWVDLNHDGISQKEELYTLNQLGISSISVEAAPEMRRDQYGNMFRLRAKFVIRGMQRQAYDVYFATSPN